MELKKVIEEDCKYYTKLFDKGFYCKAILYLEENENSEQNKLYSLMLNGYELHFGTLEEINAIVKSLIKIKERKLI